MKRPSALVYDPQRSCWLRFDAPTLVRSSRAAADVLSIINQAQDASAQAGLWSIGWVSYEAAPAFDSSLQVREDSELPLVWFGQYEQPTLLDELPPPEQTAPLSWQAGMSESEYAEAFAAVHQHISRGDTYQVNLSFRMQARGVTDAYSLFHAMVAQQAGRYSFFIDAGRFAVCSASPELFFELSGGSIVCRPMKGTAKRQGPFSLDRVIGDQLSSSEKERAENVMIVDMVRNDLSRIATDGSVRVSSLFEVERFPGVLQMVSEVRAATTASLVDVLGATFPSASITGAPKQSTMGIIQRVENSPRGVYTGALGIITPDDRAWFNVAIRTAVVDQFSESAEYGVGSGVVWDSQEGREYNECLLKAHVIGPGRARPGLFETLLWDEVNGYWLLDYHIERLAQSALHFGYPCNAEQVKRRLVATVESRDNREAQLRVKLVLDPLGTMRTEATPIATLPKPYRVAFACQSVSSTDPRLFHKSTDRSVYDAAIPAVSGADDILLWNERREITESRIANVIVSLDGALYTPPVSSGLLAGCFRRDLLERGRVVERVITIEDLKRADSVYLANSLRGMWGVEVILERNVRLGFGHEPPHGIFCG
jgi:para-aminobenzoate synthetase/4-amino-4-deoxychorismate lyase